MSDIWGRVSSWSVHSCCTIGTDCPDRKLLNMTGQQGEPRRHPEPWQMMRNYIFQQDQIQFLNDLSQQSVKNLKDWITKNVLLVNSDKTNILLIGPQNSAQCHRLKFASRCMYCYFLYSQKCGCYIRQQQIIFPMLQKQHSSILETLPRYRTC